METFRQFIQNYTTLPDSDWTEILQCFEHRTIEKDEAFIPNNFNIPRYADTGARNQYHFSHTDSTIASSEKIWQIWTDVPHWKEWDKGLKEAIIHGAFIVGTKGNLIPDKGPKSKFVISELVPNQSYTFKTNIPFGWLIIKRTLEVKEGKTYFTHDVAFTGLLKKILGNKLGKNYRAMLPGVLSEIKKIAERK